MEIEKAFDLFYHKWNFGLGSEKFVLVFSFKDFFFCKLILPYILENELLS